MYAAMTRDESQRSILAYCEVATLIDMKYWRKPLDLEEHKGNLGKVIIIEDRCKGCEFCITFCPRGVLRMSDHYNKKGYHHPEVVDPSKCVNCTFCQALCPDFAIYAVEDDENQ